MKKLIIGLVAAICVAIPTSLVTSGVSWSTVTTTKCFTAHDHITKTDNGHGNPAEWADLSMERTTKVCGDKATGYKVTLTDDGSLWTRTGAGYPNGTPGQIANRVHGKVHGVYSLAVTGGDGTVKHHGDVSKSSTEYVKSLFSEGVVVAGGDYSWRYTTRCKETWVDSSKNDDGRDVTAGNITGKRCWTRPPHPKPKPTVPEPQTTPPVVTPPVNAPGDAPAPTPVNSDLPVTG